MIARSLLRSFLWALAAAAAACNGTSVSTAPSCKADVDCVDGGCVGGACVPRAIASAVWAVELTPKTGSGLAFTQLPGVSLEQLTSLPVDEIVKVAASFETVSFQRAVYAQEAAMVLRVAVISPSQIEGRPPQQIEATAAPNFSVSSPILDLGLPRSWLDDVVTVRTVASSPTDQRIPPFAFLAKPTGSIVVTLPTDQALVHVTGKLVSATGEPLGGYTARVWPAPAGELVSPSNSGMPLSTVATTSAADGSFSLALSSSYMATGVVGSMVVELVPPADLEVPAPRFVSAPFSADVATWKALSLTMAPYINPLSYRIKIVGDDSNGGLVGVANVAARFRAKLESSSGGVAQYFVESQSGSDGMVELSLIPGGSLQPQRYQVLMTPGSDSPYASVCMNNYSVAAAGNGSPVYGPEVKLVRKALLSGVVLAADGTPARNVTVRATQSQPADTACGVVSSFGASAITDHSGLFVLRVDPGTYILDVDPPTGSPLPRLTEDGVVVLGDTLHDVQLLPAGILEASVVNARQVGSDGLGVTLPETGVRVFRMLCSDGNAPPCFESPVRAILAGQGQSDSTGKVRLILPAR